LRAELKLEAKLTSEGRQRICAECNEEWPAAEFEYRKILIGDYGVDENAPPVESYIVAVCPRGHQTKIAELQ